MSLQNYFTCVSKFQKTIISDHSTDIGLCLGYTLRKVLSYHIGFPLSKPNRIIMPGLCKTCFLSRHLFEVILYMCLLSHVMRPSNCSAPIPPRGSSGVKGIIKLIKKGGAFEKRVIIALI